MAIKPWIAAASLFLALSCVVRAQEKKPLTNQDVVAMINGGLDNATILMAIQTSPSEFDVSVQALIDLKRQKVSETLIRAMVALEGQKRGATSNVANSAVGNSAPAGTSVGYGPARFTAFPVDFCAEQVVRLGANAPELSEAKLYAGKGRLRVESAGRQPQKTTIVDPLKPVAYVLEAGKPAETKTVFQGVRGAPLESGLSKFLLPADPQEPCANWDDVECTAMGKETIRGRATTKWDLKHTFADVTWHSYIWVDVRLNVVSKRQFMENTYELRDIVEAAQPSGLFELP